MASSLCAKVGRWQFLLTTVSAVVICGDGQKSDEVTIPVRSAAPRLRDA